MKKLLSVLLAFTIIVSAFTVGFTVSAEDTDTDTLAVTVNGVTTDVKVGDTFVYTYTLSDLALVNTEASVDFDSDYLEVIDVSEDDEDAYDLYLQETFPKVYDTVVCNTELTDNILYNFSKTKGYTFGTDDVLATFTFKALAAGETTLGTTVLEMANTNKEFLVKKSSDGPVKYIDFTYSEFITYEPVIDPSEDPSEDPTEEPSEDPSEDPSEEPSEDQKPIKVENIVATPESSTAVLTWDAVEGATKYWIYKNKNDSYVAYTSTTGTQITVGGLDGNSTYQVKIVAVFEDGTMQKLSDADVVEFTTLAPVVVDGLVVTPDMTSVKLSWNPVEGAQKYWIYKAFEENGPFYVYDATTELNYTVKRLQPDTTYYFKVVPAILSNGMLALGEPEAAQKIEAKTATGEAITVKITDLTSTTATISWPAHEDAVKYWVIFSTATKSTSDLTKWTTWAETTDTTYTFKWREPGKYYYFSVVALYNDAETGRQETVNYLADGARMPYSDDDMITFTPVDDDTVTLTWAEDTGATKVWVSYYDESGKETIIASTQTNTITLNLEGYKNYSYGLNALDSTGNVGYLTRPGGEAYHE